MKKWIIGLIFTIGVIGLGVGGAFLVNHFYPVSSVSNAAAVTGQDDVQPFWNSPRGGMRGSQGQPGRGGQPYFPYSQPQSSTGERISADDAAQVAKNYISNYTETLTVSQVMEFQNDFLIVVTEKDTGRGAFTLLVNPFSGRITQEMLMGWNLKYSRMSQHMNLSVTENTLSAADALTSAQAVLSKQVSGASLDDAPISFYGYYLFTYSIDGKVSGIVEVNGLDGQVRFVNRLGDFIRTKEIQ